MFVNGRASACHASPSSPTSTGLARHHSPWTMDRARKKNRPHQEGNDECILPECISEDEGALLTVSPSFFNQFWSVFSIPVFLGEPGCETDECSEAILEMEQMSMGTRFRPTDKKGLKTRFSTGFFLPTIFSAGVMVKVVSDELSLNCLLGTFPVVTLGIGIIRIT